MKVIAAGVPAAFVALLAAEVGIALSGEYLVNVDYVVDERVAPPESATVAPDTPRADGTAPPDDVFRLVVLGDSTAAGVGATDVASSLPVQIARRVARGSGRVVHVTGLGVSGARTYDVATTQVPLMPEDGVDAVVVVIGSNDVTHITAPWTMAEQTRAMTIALRDRTEAPVILGGIPRFAGVDALLQPLRGLTDRYAGVLRAQQETAVEGLEHVTFVDIASLASPRFIGRPDAMSSDDFHPSAVGYGFWADALAPPVAVIAARSAL